MIRFFIYLIAFLLVENLWASEMAFDGKKMISEPKRILKKEDSGQVIRLRPGEIFQVELQALGAAGYGWYLDVLDPEYIELISEETKVHPEKRIGGPVLLLWRFKAKKEGAAEIRMHYYRKWEGIGKAEDSFFLKIQIY